MRKKIYFPKLNIEESELLNFLKIYDVTCKSKSSREEGGISIEYCHNCIHFKECVIWNDEKFIDFHEKNQCCKNCGNPLTRGYLYLIWRFSLKELLQKDFQFICCSCYRLKNNNINGMKDE